MLHLLYELREDLRLHIEVAHLQHGIRGAEAREDARFVAALAGALRLNFHSKEIDLPAKKSAAGKGNLEALARAERYEFFAQVMRDRQLAKGGNRDTLDDQAETVLLRFLRGAGARGLSGIAPRVELHANETKYGEEITVIRPFLEISETEIIDYLNQKGVGYRTDRTNFD